MESVKQGRFVRLIFDNSNPVIVGSGPSAAVIAEFLVSRGLMPTVFDAHTDTNIDESEAKELKELGFKPHLNSFDSYYQSNCSNIHYEKNFMARQSFKFGGFSRVWGATLSIFTSIESWPDKIKPNEKDLSFVKSYLNWEMDLLSIQSSKKNYFDYPLDYISKLNFKSRNYFAQLAKLGVASEGTRKCLNYNDCLNGCPADSIWFAGNSMDKLIDEGRIKYVKDSFLHSIKKENNKTILSFQNSKNEFFEVESEQSYLGLGPIGTAAVLIRSKIFSEVNIADSHTMFVAAFSLRKRRHQETINLSQWWIKKTKDFKVAAQIYAPDKKFAPIAVKKMPQFVLFKKIIAKLLVAHMHPMLVYFDSRISGTINLSTNKSDILVMGKLDKVQRRSIRRALMGLRLNLMRVGLYIPFFVFKVGYAGTGFHSGSFLKYGVDINEFGEIYNYEGVHIIDASTLPTIEPGSITPTIMINAVRIARITQERDLECSR
jgi:hypothetical protein